MSDSTNKILLKVTNYDELLNIPFLRDILVLSHIMNTLRSSQRFVVFTAGLPESPVKIRDEIFGLLTTVSFVYGGIEATARILNQRASSLSKLKNDIAWVINEHKQGDSFFNTTLKDIRNRVVFHFGVPITDAILKSSVKEFPPVFAEGSSDQIIDLSYTLADNVIEEILTNFEKSSGTSEVKAYQLVQKITEYTLKLSEVLDKVIAELVNNYADRCE